MWLFQWLRTLTKWLLFSLQLMPAAALLVAILVDEGPSGEARAQAHFFPLVLWLFDDFGWTCARNSVVFALLVSVGSLVLGVGLLCALARLGAWGRRTLGAAVLALAAISPAFLALGITGLLGEPERWPWPLAAVESGSRGASLESWSGVSLWVVWIWSSLPAGAALVALAAESTFRRLDPAWDEAARLAGAGRFRIVKDLSWPIVRPAAARGAGLVFLLALVEPGAPLILGLRRTLAFQIYTSASERAPYPRTAVWALMAGLLGLAGWLAFRWKGGSSILTEPAESMPQGDFGRRSERVSPVLSIIAALVVGLWAFVGWLPVFGLIRQAVEGGRPRGTTVRAAALYFVSPIAALDDQVIVKVLLNSALFGLAVATGILLLGWARGLDSRLRSGKTWRPWLRPIIELPPLLLGAGVLALPWLLGLASRLLLDRDQTRAAIVLGELAAAIDPHEDAWILMACCVGLVLLPRFRGNGRIPPGLNPAAGRHDSCVDAAVLSGASRLNAWLLRRPWRLSQFFGRYTLVCALAATNLTPALLFSAGSDAKTLGPAVLELAAGDSGARAQAAALALTAVVANLVAIAFAHGTRALPGGREFV